MPLNDVEICDRANAGMIEPFEPKLIRQVQYDSDPFAINNPHAIATRPVISYGLGSFGYDIRLSPKEFFVFKHVPGKVVDPKNFSTENLEPAPLHSDDNGDFFILPGNSYGLGVAIECLNVPSDITVICVGKSTYARTGIISNVTPAESGWKGHLTLEFSNSSSADCRIYANEGVVQLLFLKGEPCSVSYQTRMGKYQNQSEEVTIARV